MFSDSAEFYDLIHSSFKDYAAEAAELAQTIRHAHPTARTLLDVGCSTGEHARLLSEVHGFAADGLDVNAALVQLARAKLRNGSVFEADMVSFQLERRYDVIVCLFSAIGYVLTLENVRRTLERFRLHLQPGGIVLVEPWFPPGVLEPGRIFLKSAETADVTVSRMSLAKIEGRLSRLHFEYMFGRPDGITHASEVHELGLFTTEEMLECFRHAGLQATHDPQGPYGRGLFIAHS